MGPLKKKYRVKRSDEIKALLDAQNVRKNAFFSVYTKKNSLPHFRYAISVPQKAGKAVVRNKIKRRVRHIIADCGIEKPVDIFIIVRPKAAQVSFSELKTQIEKLLKKHKLI